MGVDFGRLNVFFSTLNDYNDREVHFYGLKTNEWRTTLEVDQELKYKPKLNPIWKTFIDPFRIVIIGGSYSGRSTLFKNIAYITNKYNSKSNFPFGKYYNTDLIIWIQQFVISGIKNLVKFYKDINLLQVFNFNFFFLKP